MMLTAVTALVLYAPIRYNFIYPTGGDDTAIHMWSLVSITENLGNSHPGGYYGVFSLLPLTLVGLDAVTVFFWFNYAVLIGVFVSLWLLLRRFYGLPAALLGFPLTVLLPKGIWHYFNDGTIFNIANLYVLGILAIVCLALWLESGKLRYLVLSGALFLATAVYHSVTYLLILVSMLLFFAGFLVYRWVRRESCARLACSAGVFCLSAPLAYLAWFSGSVPEQRIARMLAGEPVVEVPPVSFTGSVDDYLSTTTIAAVLLVVGALTVALLYRAGVRDGLDRLNQPVTYILLSFLVVSAVGAFTVLGSNSERFMRELSSFVGILASALLGVSLSCLWKCRGVYRSILSVILAASLISVSAGAAASMKRWASDYSAVRPADVKVIDYLNSLSEGARVLVSPQVACWIYELYVKDGVELTHDPDGRADYVVYRNGNMTLGTTSSVYRDSAKLRTEWAEWAGRNLTEEPTIVIRGNGELVIKIWVEDQPNTKGGELE